MTTAFTTVKTVLANATLLAHPQPTAILALATDASYSYLGAVLQQFHNNSWQPLPFFSAKLSPPQQKYSTFDRELQAIYSTILHFRSSLEGPLFNFTLTTTPSSPPFMSLPYQNQLGSNVNWLSFLNLLPLPSTLLATQIQ